MFLQEYERLFTHRKKIEDNFEIVSGDYKEKEQ